MNIEPWLDVLERNLPWETSDHRFSVEFVRDSCEAADGQLQACIRTINWDVDDDGSRMLRDIKEQMVALGRVENLDDIDRYEAFIRASGEAFSSIGEGVDFDTFLPADFFFPEVLDQQNRTFDDFGKSLSVRSRYGGFQD